MRGHGCSPATFRCASRVSLLDMESLGLVSWDVFNGAITPINCADSFSDHKKLHDSIGNCSNMVNGNHVDCTSTATVKPGCSEFDEDFEVNGSEEVNTPRSSPTLLELRKMLEDFKPMVSKSSRLHDRNDHLRENSNFILRSLKEVTSRPCQYPLEKLYDETVPVRTLQRSLIKGVRLGQDRAAISDTGSVLNRPHVPHPSVRRLDSILTCPTSPLPRLSSYCSSSGSLIGNMNGIPLSEDNLFRSEDLFPPTLSKTLYKESKQQQVTNGYSEGLYLLHFDHFFTRVSLRRRF